MLMIKWKWTCHNGSYGTWIAQTADGKTAGGTWRVGSWEVCHNDTDIDDDVWDLILDDPCFWTTPSEDLELPAVSDDSSAGTWDGAKLTVIN